MVSKVINKNSVLPVLEDYLFEVSHTPAGHVLTVIATDLENSISVSVKCESESVFSFAVPAIQLKIVEKLENEDLTFAYDNNTFSISVTGQNDKMKITGENPLDFPIVPKFDCTEFLGTVKSEFYPALKIMQKYVGKDDLRPAMTGVFFEASKDGYRLTATDAHVLKHKHQAGEFVIMDETAKNNAILPAKFCKLLAGFDNAENTTIAKTEHNIFACLDFEAGKYKAVLVGRSIEASYPDYKAVTPQNNPIEVCAQIKPLLKLIDKAAMYANKTTYQGIFSINGDIKISSQDLDFCHEYSGKIEHLGHNGENIEVGFNLQFVSKILKDLDTDCTTLELSTPTRAGVFRELNGYTLIMPVMINA